jgi:hypothetical protein
MAIKMKYLNSHQMLRYRHISCLYMSELYFLQVYQQKVGLEVLGAVTMENMLFWVLTPCRLVKGRIFGGRYRLHLQDRRILPCFSLVSCLASLRP